MLTLRPSAALACADCVQLGEAADGSPVLDIAPGLTDAQLLPLLEPYRRYRVWRLSMHGVGAPQRAFGGFADPAAAANFDARMERITGEWCCRWAPGLRCVWAAGSLCLWGVVVQHSTPIC